MNVFDSHFHIINPNYPLVPNNGYVPPTFTVKNYQEKVAKLAVKGGVIVSGSFQQFEQQYLIDALRILGKTYFGVANVPIDMKAKELEKLNAANVKAVRFNLRRGGSETINNMVVLANKLFERYGWHSELYVDSKALSNLRRILNEIPAFSIDHLGLSKDGLSELYYWVERGVKIKATGFGRLDFDPIPVLKTIHAIDPKALLFGTDLPSTRASIPFSNAHFRMVKDNFSKEELHRIVYQNGVDWYTKKKY